MMNFITHAPIWVWCILVFLSYLGYQQTKAADVKPIRMLLAPIISALLFLRVLYVHNDSFVAIIIIMFALLFGMALAWLRWHKSTAFVYDTEIAMWQRKGSFIPLFIYLYIFILRYIAIALSYASEIIVENLSKYVPKIVDKEIDNIVAQLTLGLDAMTSIGIGVLVAMVLFSWLKSAKSPK